MLLAARGAPLRRVQVAIVQMSSEFGWDKVQQAQILGAFFWGYASSQILAGKLCAWQVRVWACRGRRAGRT